VIEQMLRNLFVGDPPGNHDPRPPATHPEDPSLGIDSLRDP